MAFTIFFVLWISSLIRLSEATNEEGLKFLEENRKKSGVVTLPSGLQYKVLKRGVSEKNKQTVRGSTN
jgi:FKBP-type peptidyl-prolyl cis-trans isomerase